MTMKQLQKQFYFLCGRIGGVHSRIKLAESHGDKVTADANRALLPGLNKELNQVKTQMWRIQFDRISKQLKDE